MARLSILHGALEGIIPWLIEQELTHVATLVIQPQLAQDPIALGNALAKTVNHAIGSSLLGNGIDWHYAITLLKLYQAEFSNLELLVVCAENAPEFAYALSSLEDIRVLLHFSRDFPADNYPEARLFTFTTSGPSRNEKPSPAPKVIQMRVSRHLRQRQWQDALALLIEHLPGELPNHLEAVATGLLQQGLHHHLFEQLNGLEAALKKNPEVLRWWVWAALDSGNVSAVIKDLEIYLSTHLEPEFQALYSLCLYALSQHAKAKQQSQAALAQSPSTLTFLAAGYIAQTRDLEGSSHLLTQALQVAEVEGNALLQTRITLHLAENCLEEWRPQGMVEWANWAMRVMAEHGVNLTPLRIQAVNYQCLGRIYQGDTVGIEEQLLREAHCLKDSNPRMHNLFEWTRAEFLCLEERYGEALEVMQSIWNRVKQRDSFAQYAATYVRVLLEQDQTAEAVAAAQKALVLCSPDFQAKARLAWAIAHGLQHPAEVIEPLQDLVAAFTALNYRLNALQAGLYLARAFQALGRDSEAEAVLNNLEPVARRFGCGLRALVGPTAAFTEIFERFEGGKSALELDFLGARKARFNGNPLLLRQRQADILATLAIKNHGCTSEQLALAVYGEIGKPTSIKAEVSALRQIVPLASKPYKIAVEFASDFGEFGKFIKRGNLRKAVGLYKGPLLPESVAPLVVEERLALEETLREAALYSEDGEAVLAVAEILQEDLEVWSRAIGKLPELDPRRAIAEARRAHVVRNWLN